MNFVDFIGNNWFLFLVVAVISFGVLALNMAATLLFVTKIQNLSLFAVNMFIHIVTALSGIASLICLIGSFVVNLINQN